MNYAHGRLLYPREVEEETMYLVYTNEIIIKAMTVREILEELHLDIRGYIFDNRLEDREEVRNAMALMKDLHEITNHLEHHPTEFEQKHERIFEYYGFIIQSELRDNTRTSNGGSYFSLQ